jgi:ankyrin repeat protein
MRAAFKGRADAVRDLLGRGADVDAADAEGYTALHCAAEAGRAGVVDVLLRHGANAKATTAKGRTAAEVAAATGKSKVMRLLETLYTSSSRAPACCYCQSWNPRRVC